MDNSLVCAACGTPGSGRFCSHCGASLPGQVECAACGNEIPAGGRFCNLCGAAAARTASAGPMAGRRPPVVALGGVALVAVAVVAGVLLYSRGPQEAATATAGGPAPGGEFGDARSVDIASMTPEERAGSLFNRVMQNVSNGDTVQARFFLPMALAAYEQVGALDADGHYHVAVLHLMGGDAAAARARADTILAANPDHLFGLFTAAQAAEAQGNAAEARELYERFGRAFAAESTAARAEYSEHSQLLPIMKQEAAAKVTAP